MSLYKIHARATGVDSSHGTTGLKRLVAKYLPSMTDSGQPPSPDRLTDHLEAGDHEGVMTCLDRLDAADAETRKRTLQAIRDLATERPSTFEGLVSSFVPFLTDDDRAVRLTAAKLFVTLAQTAPATVVPVVDSLAERLADAEEFYYLRARCAEALGYVAVESPADVTDPETLADLRIGLEFDEPEVKQKLAKALAHVALGDPSRLRHHVSSLSEHLDDEHELVRYHLCTALVVIGCAYPRKLDDATAPLREQLDDDNPYVRGRAAEALGLLAGSDVATEWSPDAVASAVKDDDVPSFLTDRMRFCRRQLSGEQSGAAPDGVATFESVRAGTDDVVAEMTTPNDGECPHCGLVVAESGPPMCPRCGAPR
jgi:HEAT repeat protein